MAESEMTFEEELPATNTETAGPSIPEYTGEKSELDALESESGGNYIKMLPQGSTEKLKIYCKSYQKTLKKVVNDTMVLELKVSDGKGGTTGKGFYYVLKDIGDQELAVTNWPLHIALSNKFRDLGKINGVILNIGHPGKGEYTIEVLEE